MADIVQVQDEGNQVIVVQGDAYTVCNIIESGVEIEKVSFLQLEDTPSSYEGAEGQTVRVKEDGSGLEFGRSYNSFISLDDTPSSYSNSSGKLVVVNQAGNGISFIDYTVGDINIEYFTQLADVPGSYVNQKNNIPVVKEDESGLEFKGIDSVLPDQSNVTPGSYRYPQITIDKKGRITLVQEGKPFEFNEFVANQLLVGDGTNIPKQLALGQQNQVLSTGANQVPSWNYQNILYQEGLPILEAKHNSASDSSKLIINTSASKIQILPQDSSQDIAIGPFDDLVISDQSITVNQELVIPKNTGITVSGNNGLKIDPGTSTVGIKNVAVNVYNNRIGLSDFITRSWYESQPIPVAQGTYLKTATQQLQGGTLSFSIPNGATVKSISLKMNSSFNTEAKIRVYDSLTNELIDPEDSPLLDENTEILVNQKVAADAYQVFVSVENYSYGYADCYITYFTK